MTPDSRLESATAPDRRAAAAQQLFIYGPEKLSKYMQWCAKVSLHALSMSQE